MYYQNVRGLRTKTVQFYNDVIINDYEVIIITETWLSEGILSEELFPPGYVIHRRDRDSRATGKTRGGGVLIAVKSCFQTVSYETPGSLVEELWIGLSFEDHRYVIGVVYIPPGSTLGLYEEHIETINYVRDNLPNTDVVVVGDYNLPGFIKSYKICDSNNSQFREECFSFATLFNSSDSLVFVSTNQRELLLHDCVAFHDFVQINNIVNANNTILDLVFTNQSNIIVNASSSYLTHADSHHPPLEIVLCDDEITTTTDADELCVFNFYKADYEKLNDYLGNVEWDTLYNFSNNIDQAVDFLYCVLYDAINMFVPKKLVNTLRFPSYFSQSTIRLIKDKNKIFNKLKKDASPAIECRYRQLRVQSKLAIKNDYKKFLESTQQRILENIRSFWGYLKSKRVVAGYPSQMKYNNNISHDAEVISNMFADFFQSVYRAHHVNTFNIESIPLGNINLCNIEMNSDVVFNKFVDLDTNKGPGPDGIPPLFVRNCSPTLAWPMSIIFSMSISCKTFPSNWKIGTVTPLLKSGDRSDVTNYRPITGLSCFAKVLESIVKDTFFSAFKNNISENQHGFFPERSCETNLVVYTNFLSGAIDSQCQVDSVYFDFKKAFDTVDHSILIRKLGRYGVGDPLLSWINSYLTQRTQIVKFNGNKSKEIYVHSGVPQGSHLGPALFLVFINDLCNNLKHCQYLFFADDLKIFRRISSDYDCIMLQQDIDALTNWCINNGMVLNCSKCQVISFTRKRQLVNCNYVVEGTQVKRTNLIKDLGVLFDNELRFIHHIDYVVAKAFRMLGFTLRQCWDFNNIATLKTIYYALVRSHLEYCSIVWSPLYKIHIKKIERVQSKYMSFLLRKLHIDPQNIPLPERHNLSGLVSLETRRECLALCFGHKIINGHINCSSLLGLIDFRVPSRATRLTELFRVRPSRSDVGKNEPINRVMTLLNGVQHVRLDLHLNIFKNRIMSALHEK